MTSLLWLVIILAFARWVITQGLSREGRTELGAAQADEIRRLREEVDQLNAQVLRLSDEQSFLTRLLTEGKTDEPPQALPPTSQAAPGAAEPENP